MFHRGAHEINLFWASHVVRLVFHGGKKKKENGHARNSLIPTIGPPFVRVLQPDDCLETEYHPVILFMDF